MIISRAKRAFEVKWKTFFLVSQVLSFKLTKQTSKYVTDTTFKCHKTKQLVAWITHAKVNIWIWALEAIFYFAKSFLTRNIVSPLKQMPLAGIGLTADCGAESCPPGVGKSSYCEMRNILLRYLRTQRTLHTSVNYRYF